MVPNGTTQGWVCLLTKNPIKHIQIIKDLKDIWCHLSLFASWEKTIRWPFLPSLYYLNFD
jgi:hypothetical protein